MNQEREKQESSEREIPIDSPQEEGDYRVNEGIEPLQEGQDESVEKEIDLNSVMSQHDNVENEIELDFEIGEKEDNGTRAEIENPENETLENNESNEAPQLEDTPSEDLKPVEKSKNDTEIKEADSLEYSGADNVPSQAITESDPQSVAEHAEERSKLEADTENAPSETLSENDVSEEEPAAGDVEAIDDIKEAVEKEDVDEDRNTKADDIKRAVKRVNFSRLAFSIFLMFAITVVLFAYAKPWHYRLKKQAQSLLAEPPAQVPDEIPDAHPAKVSKPVQNDPYHSYRTKLREVSRLRENLLLKKQEIGELKNHYRKGIKTLENEILQEILRNYIHSFQKALRNKRIELNIRAIQRRLVYINKLDGPLKWLEQGSEELLFLKRKATYDLQLVEIASGIDMDVHMRHINAALQKFRLTADNLAINTDDAELKPLETLWNRLYSKTKNNPHLLADIENWFIEQEICGGDLKRIGGLTGISTEAARCIAKMDGSDLFLNGIEDLSPTIAKHLCQWKGKWICLNSVRILSPSAAEHLFQWEGEWISLNGLSDFPSELAKYLAQWKGKQLELMGLTFNKDKHDKIAIEYMAEWEKAGGKLFVPDSIRTMIDMVKKI